MGDQVYKVIVDYSMTLAEMLKTLKGDWGIFPQNDINLTFPWLVANFSLQGYGKHEEELVQIQAPKKVMTQEALRYLDTLNLTPAKIEHLIAFEPFLLEMNCWWDFCTVALGSVIDKGSCPIYPAYHQRGRFTIYHLDNFAWGPLAKFLAIRKK